MTLYGKKLNFKNYNNINNIKNTIKKKNIYI